MACLFSGGACQCAFDSDGVNCRGSGLDFGRLLISATRIWGKEPTGKAFGAWGVNLASRDLRTPAGDDFFAYANGSWLAKTEIPSDQSSTSAGRDVFNLTQDQLRELIEASAAKATTPTGAQIGGLYKSFMDEAGVEAADAKPLASDLAAIQAVSSKQDFVRLMGKTATNFGSSVFALGCTPTRRSRCRRCTRSGRAGNAGPRLLPDRRLQGQEGAAEAYIARTFTLIKDPAADEKARAVLAFETEIAKASWAAADRRQIDKL